MQNKNNNSKSSELELSPADIKNCFFAIENEFTMVEKEFLIFQLRKRTSLKLAGSFPLRHLGVDWLIWFLNNIQPSLTNFGGTLALIMSQKMAKYQRGEYVTFSYNELRRYEYTALTK